MEQHWLFKSNTADERIGRCFLLTLFLLFDGVFGDAVMTLSVMEGDSVTLNTNITKKQHDKILWYFDDTRIALINGHPNTSCLYDGEDGRFRDRLEVDYETGSLNITNIRSEHVGRYEAELIRSESSGKRQSLNRNRKCDSTKITRKISSSHDDTIKTYSVIISASLSDQDETNEEPYMEKHAADLIPGSGPSSAVVAGIAVAVLLVCVASAVGVMMYLRHRSTRKGKHHLQIL
ncbi:uncharacterized protein LOC130086981 [Rhinichthys klamathensis goyatoka]|uniref:uncharacterized protein LOC130086981 n=1 Tax=Rhinichthys klamathensis goyatoka TaxID=3034132 RepID=UPI0024B533DC|nr:uncharacterized protein LOC130086981 [Rhinichthys klamathensis goyatoka]